MTTLQAIYDSINEFRIHPSDFHPSCGYGSLRLSPYQIDTRLEQAASWQASHLCQPISHQTCTQYCHMFNNSCRHIERIKSFILPSQSWNENELLVIGPKRPFRSLVNSQGHCEKLLASNLNTIGGAILGNIFILVMVWLPN